MRAGVRDPAFTSAVYNWIAISAHQSNTDGQTFANFFLIGHSNDLPLHGTCFRQCRQWESLCTDLTQSPPAFPAPGALSSVSACSSLIGGFCKLAVCTGTERLTDMYQLRYCMLQIQWAYPSEVAPHACIFTTHASPIHLYKICHLSNLLRNVPRPVSRVGLATPMSAAIHGKWSKGEGGCLHSDA